MYGYPNGVTSTGNLFSGLLDNDSDDWTITEHFPSSSPSVRDIKTFAVGFTGPTANGHNGFEVEYINIVYRSKHAK